MPPRTAPDVRPHRRAGQQQTWKIKKRVNPVRPTGYESMKVTKSFFRPHIQTAFMTKSRGEFGNHKGCGNKKEQCCQHPQADRGCPVVRRGGNPAWAQDGRDVEKQDVPESHFFAKLLDGIARAVRRLAHRVSSRAGISSSCLRKLTMKGSS